VTVNESELKVVLEKLDSLQLEILRLRAMLLPQEEATAEEKKHIKAAKKEIVKGSKVNLKEFVKELGC
jgi:hypothetical protein